MKQPDFGDLRALMNAPYSRQIWEQLCDWVNNWDADDYRHTVLPYLEGHLHIWDDTRRFVPRRWQKDFVEGNAVQGIEIARSLDLANWTRNKRYMRWSQHTFSPELFSNPGWKYIAHLDLSNNVLDEAGLELFSSSPYNEKLRVLLLQRMAMHERDLTRMVELLADAPWLAQLEHLDLSHLDCPSTRLFEYTNLPELHTLVLRDTHSFQSVKVLAENHPDLPLRHLDISQTKDVVYHQIDRLGVFTQLEHLSMSMCHFYVSSMKALGESAVSHSLRRLEMSGCMIDRKKLEALCTHWPEQSSLEVLDLSNNPLDKEAIERLLAHPLCTRLEELNLSNSNLDQDTLELLVGSGSFSSDAQVLLYGNTSDEAMRQRIAKDPELSDIFKL